MQRINYHHLYYFWSIVREGSIAKASEKLHLTQPTISAQLAQFEEATGHKLFERVGRGLILTDTGNDVFEYADAIFSLGRELTQYLNGGASGKGYRLNVGIADALPKLVVMELLKPALQIGVPVKLQCHEDKTDRLMNELSLRSIDLILTSGPGNLRTPGGISSQLLAESALSIFAAPELAAEYREGFPKSLDGAPFLLPTGHAGLRQEIDEWFRAQDIWPDIRAEISDSALMKTFGGEGIGLFFAPRIVEKVIMRQYGVETVGVTSELKERFYLLTVPRKMNHPALSAIIEHARQAVSSQALPRKGMI